MSTMATGMAFGAGSEIAHQGVRAMMGGSSGHGSAPVEQQQQQAAPQQYEAQPQQFAQQEQMENPCLGFSQTFMQCLQQNRNEVGMCQQYMDNLTQCERDNTMQYNNQY